MKIKDLYNNTIEIVDLDKAIKQVNLYLNFEDLESPKLTEERKKYWSDIANKLKNIKLVNNN